MYWKTPPDRPSMTGPAVREWEEVWAEVSEGFRWHYAEVRDVLGEAQKIREATVANPRPKGDTALWLGQASGGYSTRYTAEEITIAGEALDWPPRYLWRHPDHRRAVQRWMAKTGGERLTGYELKRFKDRTERDRRTRGFLTIATGLMRDRVPALKSIVGRSPIPDTTESGDDLPPLERAADRPNHWRAPDLLPSQPDYSPEQEADLLDAMATEALESGPEWPAIAATVNRLIGQVVEIEFAEVPEGLTRDKDLYQRSCALRSAITVRLIRAGAMRPRREETGA
jgi:hypothetical protein